MSLIPSACYFLSLALDVRVLGLLPLALGGFGTFGLGGRLLRVRGRTRLLLDVGLRLFFAGGGWTRSTLALR